MKRFRYNNFTISRNVDVDVDVEVEFEDILEYIEDYATDNQKKEIFDILEDKSPLKIKTLVDVMKHELMVKAMEKYSLEELESRLEMTYI